MKEKSGAKWTESTIDKYIKSPADYAPGIQAFLILLLIGNAMAFAGIPQAKDRADLIAYLKTKP